MAPILLGGIQYLSGPMMGKSMDLKALLTSMGKGDACKIKVKGLLVGKQAAVFTRRPRVLKDGDIIELSDMKLQFYIKKKA
jgi:hypothetical protein